MGIPGFSRLTKRKGLDVKISNGLILGSKLHGLCA